MVRLFNGLLVIVLAGVVTSAYAYQVRAAEEPCPLCLLQRLGMIGVAMGALLNLRFGVRPLHYGLSLLSALFGASVSIRQILLHICPGEPIFGIPFLGLSLYTWALIAFVCSMVAISILLFFEKVEVRGLGLLGQVSFAFLFLLALANGVTTFLECGIGAC